MSEAPIDPSLIVRLSNLKRFNKAVKKLVKVLSQALDTFAQLATLSAHPRKKPFRVPNRKARMGQLRKYNARRKGWQLQKLSRPKARKHKI